MKRKLLSIFIALVLALSLCLVTAVPVAAADPSVFTVTGGTYTTTPTGESPFQTGTISANLAGTWGAPAVIGEFTATGEGGLYGVPTPPTEPPWYGTTATISVSGTLAATEITFSGTAVRTVGDPITPDAVTDIEGTITIGSDGAFVANLTGTVASYTVYLDITGDMVGTIDLVVNDERPWEDGAFTFTNISPGGDPMEFDFKLHNVGGGDGVLTFSMSVSENDMAGAPAPNMSADEFASLVYVKEVHYQFKWPADPVTWPEGYIGGFKDDLPKWLGMDLNADGKVSLYEICQVGTIPYDDEGNPLQATAEITYFIIFQLGDSLEGDKTAGSKILTGVEDKDAQGDGISVTITANLGSDEEESSGNVFQAGTTWPPAPVTIGENGYYTIQAAVNAADSLDTINVVAGTYPEYLHITTDHLTIEGAGIDQSIIDLDDLIPYWHYGTNKSFSSRAGVLITGYGSTDEFGDPDEVVEGVTFRGFTVKNVGLNPPITATGTHTGEDDVAVLTDSSASWTPDTLIDQWVHNLDDRYIGTAGGNQPIRSYGQIISNTATTVTATLDGGLENDWDNGDMYTITPYEHFLDSSNKDGQDDVHGIGIANGKNVLIENVKVLNSGSRGITIGKARGVSTHKYSEDITVRNCIVSDSKSNGISFGQHTGTITVTGNTVTNNGRPHLSDPTREYAGIGIYATGASISQTITGVISGNTVHNSGFEGIALYKWVDGVTIENNTVTGHNRDQDGAGIFFYGGWGTTDQVKNVTVRDNMVMGNIRGIVAYNASHSVIGGDTVADGNTITTDSGAFDSGQAAIKIDNANNIVVKNNTINSPCDGVGIRVTSCNFNTLSHGNTIISNTITDAKFAGIRITKGAHDNTFEYNTITGTTSLTIGFQLPEEETQGDGVFIDDDAGMGNVFHWNDIYGNAGDGMENQTGTEVDATKNYWGDASGPDGAQAGLLLGTGNKVSANVKCMPWLTREFKEVLDDDIAYFGVSFPVQKGWNIVSAPLALNAHVTEANTEPIAETISDYPANTWGGLRNLGKIDIDAGDEYALKLHYTLKADGITKLYSPIYYYVSDPASDYFGSWQEADAFTEINPLDAFYIRMMEPDSFPVLFSPKFSVPSKELYQGWNLVGCAYMDVMFAAEGGQILTTALATIVEVSSDTGDVTGYSQVVSPPVNQAAWIFIPKPSPGTYIPEEGVDKGMILMGKGYWVFMENPGTLAGLTFTPISLGLK